MTLLNNHFPRAAIDVDARDIKALFRRCQAYEKLGKLDMAFKDVQRCATLEPKNKTFLDTLRRLGAEIQLKVSSPFWNILHKRFHKGTIYFKVTFIKQNGEIRETHCFFYYL